MNRLKWPLVTVLFACGIGILWFLVTDAAVYLSFMPESYTEYYWSRRVGLALHVASGSLALVTGLMQVCLGLRGQTHQLHRVLGRVYIVAVLCGVSASFYMAVTIPPGTPIYKSGLVGLGIAWFVTTSMGYLSVIHAVWPHTAFG